MAHTPFPKPLGAGLASQGRRERFQEVRISLVKSHSDGAQHQASCFQVLGHTTCTIMVDLKNKWSMLVEGLPFPHPTPPVSCRWFEDNFVWPGLSGPWSGAYLQVNITSGEPAD